MARFNPYAQYENTQAESADPGSLVVSVYDAAIRSVEGAAHAIRTKDYQNRVRHFDLAFDLISELRNSLNKKAGGEIAENLDRLYGFFTSELLMANANGDADRLEPVARMLRDLRSAWNEVRKQEKSASA